MSVASLMRRRRRGLFGGVIPTPLNVAAGCQLWLDAGFGVTTAGGNVTSWLDRSLNAHVGTGVSNPTHQIANSVFNNKPTVTFAPNQHVTINSAATHVTGDDIPFLWINVIRLTAFGSPFNSVCSFGNSGGLSQYSDFRVTTAGLPSLSRDDSSSSETVVSAAGAILINTIYIIIVRFNGTTADIYVNGVKDPSAAALNKNSITIDRYTIGGLLRSTFSNGSTGAIAQHVLYNPVPTITALNPLQNQWAKDYGITVTQLA